MQGKPRIELRVQRKASQHGGEWYRLRIAPTHVEIMASAVAGVRQATRTLRQLCMAGHSSAPAEGGRYRRRIAAMEIEDWPDFSARGVMLDVSRDRVPTMATLFQLVDLFAGWKLNQLQLYTEHTFAYAGHERVWRGTSPMTADQIRSLDARCRSRGIELVPNQNSLGHMEHWLRHEPYRRLAETTGEWRTPWGEVRRRPTTLCPIDPGSVELMCGLYDQLLPNFTSGTINVGCDEPWELGQGRSAAACQRRGPGRVYLDYLKKLHKVIRQRGRSMQFWADWILKYPEWVPELPRDLTPLIWGYEANHPFASQCRWIRDAGLSFYVCPGTSSWCSFAGRTANMVGNIGSAIENGRRFAAAGVLMTDWGDFGHRQQLPVSLPGFALAAALGWCGRANRDVDLAAALDRHAFASATGGAGTAWLDAGRVHEKSGVTIHNRSVFFELMNRPLARIGDVEGLTSKRMEKMQQAIGALRCRAQRVDFGSAQVREEYALTLSVLEYACQRGLLALGRGGARGRRAALIRGIRDIMERHRRLWLARCRRGGLARSQLHYRRNLREYESMT